MAKKGESIIDITRNLCDSCKHDYPDCDGNPEFGDNVENSNIIRCNSYKKQLTAYPKVEIGKDYWIYILKNEKVSMKDFIPHKRVEEDSRLDNLYYEIGNYFYTEDDCLKEIERVTKLKKK